ncbi:hypothetical protein [Fluviicola sp.]|uniref:helix-turn-helix transcriptional regulator n=1 Tax=Fluviicola sp. TaxID=1917219 RepID=UPI00281D0BAA|nr:hypothetical protein [Fluviicola sp.]MDR0802056.1 hypothetical protein [Fluviicola sp.]
MKQSYRHIILLIFFCISSNALFGTKLTAEKGINQILSEQKTRGTSFVKLFEKYTGSDFTSQTEWIRFLKKLVRQDQVFSEPDYPELCFLIGDRLNDEQRYRDAYYFFYITLCEEKNVNTSDKPYLADFHEDLGHVYYFFRRYDLSEKHLKISLHHPGVSEISKIKIYNTLSLIYRDKQDMKTSEMYLQKAYNQAVKINDEVWMGILSGNLGYIAFTKKENQKARELVEFDFQVSKKNKQPNSELNALALLIELDLQENKIAQATEKMKNLDSLMIRETSPQLLGLLYRTKTSYYEETGEDKKALANFKKYISYKEIMDEERQFLNIKNAEFQIEFEKKQGENIVYKERKKTDNLIIFGLFVICLILGLTSFIIIKQIQHKRFQDKEILTLKAREMEDELSATEREMCALLSTILDKNKVIFELSEQLETAKKNQYTQSDSERETMLNNLQSFLLLTENDWIEFKRLFEKLNPGFFEFFHNRFPEITAAEIRLATLIKLNLSNTEMARTLAISPDSVRKTNLRLRKKLDIESSDDLTRFIKAI